MLGVGKVGNSIIFRSNKLYESKCSSFGNSAKAREAYEQMNQDIYGGDFVDGEIGLTDLIKRKWHNFLEIVKNGDPAIVNKSRLIEKSLLEAASDEQIKQNLINEHYFSMVA